MSPIELRARREALGFTQSSMAEYLRVKQATVSRWESGKPPVPDWVEPIMDRLEQTVEDLIDRTVDLVNGIGPGAVLFAYPDDEGLRAALGDGDDGLPASAHRVAMARARLLTDVEPPIMQRPTGTA